jgi:hypothetical protein
MAETPFFPTTVFSQRSSGRFDAYPRRSTLEGLILHLSHSTASEVLPT